jgi:thiol-disulfide isomerase/thioredoxin
MQKNLMKRRQLLGYLGLGLVGTGVATALHYQQNPETPKTLGSESPITPSIPSAAAPASAELSKLPELTGINSWLNSQPLSIASLQGSVVLVQFWTFACINCQRTLPSVVQWHEKYAAKGLKVIGIHTPEFAFERDLNNVKQAVEQRKITYPVAIDNDFKTWKAYKNEYWPHLFLADRQGILRYDHIGEGAYPETEQIIQKLLG